MWTAEAYEELLRLWISAPARLLDPDTYNITDIDGHPIFATLPSLTHWSQAFAELYKTPPVSPST